MIEKTSPPDPLASSEIDVRYASTGSIDEATIRAAFEILSPDEQARADRFARPIHRRDFIAAHALLRRALSDWHPLNPRRWQFASGRGGKPQLAAVHASTPLSFNLAHTDGLVACAIGRGVDIGIDVETIDRHADAPAIAGRYFSAAEQAHLQACGDRSDRRFIEIWTLKEAFVKATGAGVTRALDTFSFSVDEAFAIAFDAPPGENAAAWQFAMFAPMERFRMAVAVRAVAPNRCAITARTFEL